MIILDQMIPRKISVFFIFVLSFFSVFFFSLETGVSETGEILVVIDPGHGGIDSGAVGIDGVEEKEINLKIARLISSLSYLDPKYQRINVLLTRRTDKYLAPAERIRMANKKRASLFVSIHINHYRGSYVKGISTLYPRDAPRLSHKLAEKVQDALMEKTGSKNRGTKQHRLFLRKANMPAVMLEAGFLSNPGEMRKLSTLSYRKKIATSILDGAKRFLRRG